MSATKYRPDVDGLRAVAVVGVILYHAKLGVPGGFVGVDVFFVISGYLIAKLILRELANKEFSLARFWERRIRRILPANILVAVCTIAAGLVIMFPADLMELAKTAIAQVMLCANFFFCRNAGYFDGPTEIKPLLHTWSLAVEEQFYLVFPVMLLLLRKLRRWQLQLVLGGLFVVSLALSIWGTYTHPVGTFYLLPTRAWELLSGAILAAGPSFRSAPKRWAELASWLGLGLILEAYWVFGQGTRFPGASALVPCIGTVLIIGANEAETTLGRVLSTGPVVFVGLISYSLYLWHWPILVYLRYVEGSSTPVLPRVCAVAITFVLACLSWRFVETPFRRGAGRVARWKVFAAAMVASGGIAAASVLIWGMKGLPQRFPPQILEFAEKNEYPRQYEATDSRQADRDVLPELGNTAIPRISFLVWATVMQRRSPG